MPTISVYPQFNALYYCYFVQGLVDLYGTDRVRLTREGFPEFGHDCLAFRVLEGGEGGGETRVYIHAHDSTTLAAEGLAWADVFGKVNLDSSVVPDEYRSKVVATGPGFPVRLWVPARAAWLAVRNLVSANRRLISYRRLDYDLLDKPADRDLLDCYRLHLINYAKIFTHRRLPLRAYHPGESRDDYVFFSSGLWPETHTVPEWGEANRRANLNRVAFIRACRSIPEVEFEGGFWERRRVHVTNYEDLTSPVEYDHATYIDRTRRSATVFNTPAFKKCHSWKLGEFFALGKAIISVPIVRAMPGPLVHGEHIHFVDDSVDAIRDAVHLICSDREYRRHLEENARAYYERWLEPRVIIRRLVESARAQRTASNQAGTGLLA